MVPSCFRFRTFQLLVSPFKLMKLPSLGFYFGLSIHLFRIDFDIRHNFQILNRAKKRIFDSSSLIEPKPNFNIQNVILAIA